jgi:carbamoyltransferase
MAGRILEGGSRAPLSLRSLGVFLFNQTTHRMLVQQDSAVGHRFVPNLKARIPGEDGGYFVVTNSLGFRSDFEFERASGSRPRILMFGDSYTAGDNVANADRYSDKLAALLGVEVQNYGIPGTGTDQHLLVHRKYAKDVEADLVMICVQIDSFHRIQLSHRPSIDRVTGRRVLVPKPYFELVDGQLVLRQVPVPIERPFADEEDGTSNGKREDSWKEFALKWYTRVPYLKELRHSKPLQSAGDRLVSEFFRLRGVQPYPDLYSAETPGWRLMEAILKQFIAEVKPRPVLIVPIPTMDFYLHAVKPIYQDLFARLEDRANGVHVADVSTPLINLPYEVRQKKLRYEVGGHFTPFANGFVASHMASFIQERGLLPKPASAPVSAAPAPRSSGAVHILGISCFYHNSGAAVIRDGEIVAAAEEERFTRIKNDRRFPHNAINYCLEQAGINQNDLTAIVYYDNAALTFERLSHSLMAVDRESAERMWRKIMPSWLRLKLHFPKLIRENLKYDGLVLQGAHHRSHAASCFFPSPFERAAILTIDGVGEWATASIGQGHGSTLRLLKEMRFPNSLGLLYSAMTQFTGFKVNSGEYKMMGLAPYGEPLFTKQILDHLVDLKSDGSLELNLKYFGFLHDAQMTNDDFAGLFGGPRRKPESPITRREINLARSIQAVTEEAMLRMARTAHQLTGEANLCLAGGVALNCVANGKLLREGPFRDLWIQPAAGDSGCALGVALDAYHTYFGKPRDLRADGRTTQGGSYLGPEFSEDEIRCYLDTHGYKYQYRSAAERNEFLAQQLTEGKIIGHFSGRLEFGPRSLGARSILADPRNPDTQASLNLRIKYRESFRPFAPAVMAEHAGEYFDLDCESPYMLLVAPVREERRLPLDSTIGADDDLLPVVRRLRSDIPAVTHVDYSARVQTVRRDDHPEFYDLIRAFRDKTGCAVLVNTSFNVRGEPIVCTPPDAYRCFMRTEMDILALGNFILLKGEQPQWPEGKGEGLENEDVSVASVESHPDKFLKRLGGIFDQDFWPAAQKLKGGGAVKIDVNFRRTPTTWVDAAEPEELRSIFELPDEFHAEEQNAARLTAAITKAWGPDAATEMLKPVCAQLVRAGLDFPVEADLGEEVSESVYVMF